MINVEFFKQFLKLKQKEKNVLKAYLYDNVSKDDIEKILSNYKIEDETLPFNFLLAHIFKNNPNIQTPKDIYPRLKGVLDRFHYENVVVLSALKILVKKLNELNIPIMLLKGSAMKLLDTSKSRMMSDVDCAIPLNKFEEVIKISEKIGFKIKSIFEHATEIRKNNMQSIDVHKNFIKGSKTINLCETIFTRAKEYNFYGSKVLIPCCEDMIFLLLSNGYDNILYSKPFYKNVSWLLDCKYIIDNNRNINWDIVLENINISKTCAQIKIMLELFESFVPNYIPKDLINKIQVSHEEERKFDFYTKTHLFYSRAQQLKEQIKEIKNIKNKKVKDICLLVSLVCEFLYLKIIQKVPIINTLFFDKVANRIFQI